MIPTLLAKLMVPPTRPNQVARPRLMASLSQALARPVALVTAPAGFGKTTLLGEWCIRQQERGLPVAWLSLNASDNAPTRFWTYLVAALRCIPALAAQPGFGDATLAALDARPNPSIDDFLTPLLNELTGSGLAFILVLDDYDLLTAAEISETMGLMLDRLPDKARVILLTRAEPSLPLGRLRAAGRLSELRADDLRFTLDEAASFLNHGLECGLAEEDIALLQQRAEGWAAGLQIAALSLLGRPDKHAFVSAFAGDNRHIADYFIEEVLTRQSHTVQRFLEQTSILDRLCGSLCDTVIDGHDSQALLERIEQANLFLVPLDDKRRWYRYHRLLSDLLRTRLQVTQPGLVTTLHSRASRWYEQEGFGVEAIAHALAAKEYKRVAELSERNAPGWWARPPRSFVDSYGDMPVDISASKPSLSVLAAWGYVIHGELEKAVPMLDAAERSLRGQPLDDGPAMLSFVGLARKYINTMTGVPCEVSEDDYSAPLVIPEGSAAMRNSAYLSLAFILQMNGDFDRAAMQLQAAADRDLKNNSTSALAIAISRLARLRLIEGRLGDAEAMLRQCLDAIDDLGSRHYFVSGNLNAVLADVLCERNDLAEALRQAEEAIALNATWGIPHATTLAHHAKARVLAAMGDIGSAWDLIDREERNARGRGLPCDLVSERAALRVDLWLASGNLTAATRWARDSGLSPEDPPSFRCEREHLALARVLSATGRSAAASALLVRLIAAATAGGRNGRLIEALVLLSSVQAEADIERAAGTLRRALELGQPEGYLRTFIAPSDAAARVLRLVATGGRSVGKYAQRILSPGGPDAGVERPVPTLAEPLSARELEVLGLLATGMSNNDIAAALVVTVGTVKAHVHSILGKLDAASRTQAIVRARERGLLGN